MRNEEVTLVVGGERYGGWKSVRVTRSIESIAGSFALDVSDRWGAKGEPHPIREEDECRIELGGQVVLDGWIDKRSISASADTRTLAYSGRDRAGALVDCSAILDGWSFEDVKVLKFVAAVAAPFGVSVSVQPGLNLPDVRQVAFTPGDSAFDVITRLAVRDGVLLVSDGLGGILITRSGTSRALSLVEGENIMSASVDYDGAARFQQYVVATQAAQAAGADQNFGDAGRVLTGAADAGVHRDHRVLIIRPERECLMDEARARADWEARIRAARAESVTVTVQGWRQADGDLWPVNALTRVEAPRLIGVNGDLLISQVEHSISDQGGKITQLRLVRPDAFIPEPKITSQLAAVKSSEGEWKEIRTGAKLDRKDVVANAVFAVARLNDTIRALVRKK